MLCKLITVHDVMIQWGNCAVSAALCPLPLQDSPFLLVMAYDEVHIPLFASNGFVNTVSEEMI